MTACALCRREQEINPELLRARFDEQRMLNLAQRLAIPPPVSSRRITPSASTTTAVGGGRAEKAGVKLRGSTSSREMLFGPWGDVGAMSADDIRRRWKFSSAQTSSSPGAETIGAASASEIRCAWRELQQSMCMQNQRAVSGAPIPVSESSHSRANHLSCCGDAHDSVRESGDDMTGLPNASPHSPCAGASSPTELSIRWRSLPKIPPIRAASKEDSTDAVCSDIGGLSTPCLRVRWRGENGLEGVGHLAVSELSDRLDLAMESQGIGSLSAMSLRERWHEANGLRGVGHLAVSELSDRLDLAIGSQGVGGSSASYLRERWHEAIGLEGVGHMAISELSNRLGLGPAHAIVEKRLNANILEKQVDGDNSNRKQLVEAGSTTTAVLRTRSCVATRKSAPVG